MAEAAEAKKTVVPAGAKAPQDRKPKQEKEPDVISVTVRGVDWEVPAEVMDDFELLDDLNALDQNDDVTRLPSVLRRILGDGKYKVAMNLLRNEETGRVGIEDGSDFVMELVKGLNPNS